MALREEVLPHSAFPLLHPPGHLPAQNNSFTFRKSIPCVLSPLYCISELAVHVCLINKSPPTTTFWSLFWFRTLSART